MLGARAYTGAIRKAAQRAHASCVASRCPQSRSASPEAPALPASARETGEGMSLALHPHAPYPALPPLTRGRPGGGGPPLSAHRKWCGRGGCSVGIHLRRRRGGVCRLSVSPSSLHAPPPPPPSCGTTAGFGWVGAALPPMGGGLRRRARGGVAAQPPMGGGPRRRARGGVAAQPPMGGVPRRRARGATSGGSRPRALCGRRGT